ncbi:MAG: hypothetical protein Q9180_006722, partial [Flavoplaca navasiana]
RFHDGDGDHASCSHADEPRVFVASGDNLYTQNRTHSIVHDRLSESRQDGRQRSNGTGENDDHFSIDPQSRKTAAEDDHEEIVDNLRRRPMLQHDRHSRSPSLPDPRRGDDTELEESPKRISHRVAHKHGPPETPTTFKPLHIAREDRQLEETTSLVPETSHEVARKDEQPKSTTRSNDNESESSDSETSHGIETTTFHPRHPSAVAATVELKKAQAPTEWEQTLAQHPELKPETRVERKTEDQKEAFAKLHSDAQRVLSRHLTGLDMEAMASADTHSRLGVGSWVITVTSKGCFVDSSTPNSTGITQAVTLIPLTPDMMEEDKRWRVLVRDEALRTIVEKVDASLERFQDRQNQAYQERMDLALQVGLQILSIPFPEHVEWITFDDVGGLGAATFLKTDLLRRFTILQRLEFIHCPDLPLDKAFKRGLHQLPYREV